MPLSNERILFLLNAYSSGTAQEAEAEELLMWVNESGNHDLLLKHIELLSSQHDEEGEFPDVQWEALYDRIVDQSAIPKTTPVARRISWQRWAAAAVTIGFLAAGAIFYFKKPATAPALVHAAPPARQDVAAPVKNMAVLTLSDGRRIELDSTTNGTLASQGGMQVVKQPDGRISYSGNGTDELLYNTLTVPRGSKVVTVRLSDGTQVWLNSESSLTYPAYFSGTERKLSITGEAYFEVAHQPGMPFIVTNGNLQTRVLGTHFNMNTYNDEGVGKVTLLQGRVAVSLDNQEAVLQPGQQAQVGQAIKLVNGVDVDEVMAWKNGRFQFGDKADLQVIMRKIARWYDVDISYEATGISQRFGGEIPMNSKLSEVLDILRTSGVKFTISGRKVVVKP
jgi:transmembrane sensor